jgi:hypothetical protein
VSVRMYVPSSMSRLRELLAAGGIVPTPVVGHAVTASLRAAHEGDDEEELEYAVLTAAAQDSVDTLAVGDPARRVVVVAEVAAVGEHPGGEPSLVELDEMVPLRAVVAVHVDSEDAAGDVAAARERLDGEGGAAMELLDRCLDHELGWYATQEVASLVEGCRGETWG